MSEQELSIEQQQLECLERIAFSINEVNAKTDKVILLLKKIVEKTE